MYLKEYLKKFENHRIKLFVDMDGVIADYDVGAPHDYEHKRPLYDSIKKLEEISHMENIELFILSVTRKTEGILQKQNWLDQYAPIFKKDYRIILSREANDMLDSATLKTNFLKDYQREECIIALIDDDPRVLEKVQQYCKDVVLMKDTVLVD